MKRILVVAAAVLVVVAVAVAGYARSTEQTVRLRYAETKAGVRIGGTGYCARAGLKADVRAVTAPSGLLGWSKAAIVNPQLQASAVPCGSSTDGQLQRIVVTQLWTPRSCRLQAIAGENFGDAADGADDDLAPWRIQSGDCTTVPSATYRVQGPQLTVGGDTGTVGFSGRAWGDRLCFAPTVDLQVTVVQDDEAQITSVPISLPDACLTR